MEIIGNPSKFQVLRTIRSYKILFSHMSISVLGFPKNKDTFFLNLKIKENCVFDSERYFWFTISSCGDKLGKFQEGKK